MYKIVLYLCVISFLLLCCLINNVLLYEEGSECFSSGISGKCTRVKDCPPAIELLKNTHSHNFKRCGFIQIDELVCCPLVKLREQDPSVNEPAEPRFIKRKCEQACEEIANQATPKIEFHIIKGEDTTIIDFPHMVALGYERDEGMSWDCGASIISKRFLLTAAHCIVNKVRLKPTVARMGVTLLNATNPNDYNIKNITVNPMYNPQSKHNDIALIEVDREIKYNEEIFPACLYFKHDDPLGLVVTGWGKTSISSNDDRSNVLQKATLIATPLDQCNTSYITRSSGTRTIVQTQLCAGANESDACWGDSGGPLQVLNRDGSYSIVGIISYGAGCGGKTPGVYTRVSKYLKWIEKIVWP